MVLGRVGRNRLQCEDGPCEFTVQSCTACEGGVTNIGRIGLTPCWHNAGLNLYGLGSDLVRLEVQLTFVLVGGSQAPVYCTRVSIGWSI